MPRQSIHEVFFLRRLSLFFLDIHTNRILTSNLHIITPSRIEANTDDIELNINEAQNQLLRYYRNISSDRWLMIKIFLTIIFVFLVISLMS